VDSVTTVNKVEKVTQLNFFPELSTAKQNNLESKKRAFNLKEIVDD
jgi:hypothetical protein